MIYEIYCLTLSHGLLRGTVEGIVEGALSLSPLSASEMIFFLRTVDVYILYIRIFQPSGLLFNYKMSDISTGIARLGRFFRDEITARHR